ncbi:sterol 3-beta-glucosyltransferase isoform X2 [Quercus lobata]|uniref:sterol 3-beta-glucosyltransferase isoform X2 n=1 Tax=Quercus lobata TaxID=97700 RepID=UPI001245B8E7|nr:sterol 3-beta-glucosyltransferase isoform X2 [Quercus lobata]
MEEEMEMEERSKPIAIFMAFGTKGDVYPIAAIAAAFACDQKQYNVVLITHSAHENLGHHLAGKHVAYHPILSPPVLSTDQNHETTTGSGLLELSFLLQKRMVTKEHRRECYSLVQRIFGCGQSLDGDFIVINFFALEGWSLAETFRVRCIVAAPYVVPYSAPSSFERHFKKELPLLYRYLQEATTNKVCWKDVIHWMWPLFTDSWGSWRCDDLNLSPCPFTDPVTGLPTWHDMPSSPLLLYGFSKEVVECPGCQRDLKCYLGYWPSNVRVCGFWFLPMEWQFSCKECSEISALVSSGNLQRKDELCSAHIDLHTFLKTVSTPPIFVGLSSVGSMGFLKNPQAFLYVLRTVIEITSYRFILFTAGFEALDAAVHMIAAEASSCSSQTQLSEDCISLFNSRLFCFTGSVPYKWLFPKCLVAIHHGGSGTTAAALHAGIPQVVCPFMLDQFYWAERMFWLGVAPEPLKRDQLLPDQNDDMSIREAANVLSRAINDALSPKVKACAIELAERISLENGVLEAVKTLKEELGCPD